MAKVEVRVRLRPVRLAFLVRPEDKAKTLQIFRINTCLWGGKFNPIIPFFKRMPAWWDRHGRRFESAEQIVNGYLEWFEPDFVVEARRGLAAGLAIDKRRVLQLSDVLMQEGDREKEGTGLSVLDLYRDLYQKHYQFVRRHKQPVVSVTPADPSFTMFSACVFGDFPRQAKLRYLTRAFDDAFEPDAISLTAATYERAFKTQPLSALQVGQQRLEVEYHDRQDAAIFVLDAHQPKDLIDFWNLRAVRSNVMAVPRQWLDEMSDFCRGIIRDNHRPLPGNTHGVMTSVTAMFARSISEADIKLLHKTFLAIDVPGANVIQPWYPSIWRPSPSFTMRAMRPTLTASESKKDIELPTEGGSVNFDSLSPDFAARFGNDHRWANVVRLREWSFEGQLATSYPTDFRTELKTRLRLGSEQPIPTTEGFVVFPRYRDSGEHWELLEGSAAVTQWLKDFKISITTSESGRAAQQIIKTLGGCWGVRHIANAGIVNILDDMAKGSRSMQADEFLQRVSNEAQGSLWHGGEYDYLVKRRAVELGLEVKCPKCDSWSWYSITQLDYSVTCELCLREFEFPKLERKQNSKWAYRVMGPFALRDFAMGGYAAALAIRFFSEVVTHTDRAGVTWASGLKLALPEGREVEADFILWYQPKETFGNDFPTEMVFGEAKSYGRYVKATKRADVFTPDDIDRMQALAEKFPGAILVFATMKQGFELSKGEVLRLRRLAEWGRKYEREHRRTRAPVIVLTGTELFTPYYLNEVWDAKGGKHKAFIDAHIDAADLHRLADMTQQLYLDMPAYHKWADAKWKHRAALKAKRSYSR